MLIEVAGVVEAIANANLRGNGARWQRWAVWKNLRTVALVQGMGMGARLVPKKVNYRY
ncbi:hypothetical protein QUA20_22300 [Microcoleus sp. Pol7_A1]|uniref:hypothetical protein n=1 Tax=Microcoleus sp. Pol7_A1 TaxID=2818893 RepID=UPI002FD3D03F